MFASISARRLNRDPEPWVLPDGTRSDVSGTFAVDTRGTRYVPRAEYTPVQRLEANPILDAARDTWDDGDPFGSAMAYLFPVAALVDYLGDQVPDSAGYRPGIGGSEGILTEGTWESTAVLEAVGLLSADSVVRDDDGEPGTILIAGVGEVLGEDLDRASAYALHAFAVLERIVDAATAAGLDY